MKITVNQLRRIIKEEVEKTINEIRDKPRSTRPRRPPPPPPLPASTAEEPKFKEDDVIELTQDHKLLRGISGNDTLVKSFPRGTRFAVTRVSRSDEPGGVTFDIQQMTTVDPKVSRQRRVPGGSLSREKYWILMEEEKFFIKVGTIS